MDRIKLERYATDLLRYLSANQDSLHRQTHSQEPADEMESLTVQLFLAVRIAVLNDSLADSFRDWFPGFRPVDPKVPQPLAA